MEDKFIEQYINRKSSEYASVMLQIESDEKLSNLIYDYSEMIQIESDKNYAKSISGRSSKSPFKTVHTLHFSTAAVNPNQYSRIQINFLE